jgi:hypothetical protein
MRTITVMRRETYSSLKAVDGAWRVAMGYLYRRPIDVLGQVCPGCGAELDLGRWEEGVVVCGGCSARVEVPRYVVEEVARRKARSISPEEWEVVDRWNRWEEKREKARRRTSVGFWAVLGCAILMLVLVALIMMALQVATRK